MHLLRQSFVFAITCSTLSSQIERGTRRFRARTEGFARQRPVYVRTERYANGSPEQVIERRALEAQSKSTPLTQRVPHGLRLGRPTIADHSVHPRDPFHRRHATGSPLSTGWVTRLTGSSCSIALKSQELPSRLEEGGVSPPYRVPALMKETRRIAEYLLSVFVVGIRCRDS